jgi:Mn2+/Fe2+ NRAMP family transporter
MVSGRGLAGVVRRTYPTPVLFAVCTVLVSANAVNIGADLGGMAEVTELVTGISAYVWMVLYATVAVVLMFALPYSKIVQYFKWLTVVLFSYIITAVLAKPDWLQVLRSTFVPAVHASGEYLSVIVGILGATLSPYLLFWQPSQEVEEERVKGRETVRQRMGATRTELKRSKVDVATGAFFSRLITYFITLTTAATLFANGQHHISTAKDAAEALRPLAGDAAYALFAIGFLGTGFLAIPVLAGSSAYAVSEALAWRASLERPPSWAPGFYVTIAVSVLVGLGLKMMGFSAVGMLFWSAVINGVVVPPMIAIIILLSNRADVMGDRRNTPGMNFLGWATVVVTGAAAIAMLVMLVKNGPAPSR